MEADKEGKAGSSRDGGSSHGIDVNLIKETRPVTVAAAGPEITATSSSFFACHRLRLLPHS